MNLKKLKPGERQRLLCGFARRALEDAGYEITTVRGTRRSIIWELRRDAAARRVAVRSTIDRWFAFNRQGKRWKPLDHVDDVIVAAADDVSDPQRVEIHYFPGNEVRARLEKAYAARKAAGQVVREDFGLWIALDRHDDANAPTRTGSGIVEDFPPIASYPLDEGRDMIDREDLARFPDGAQLETGSRKRTIAEIKAAAAEEIARVAGVPLEKVEIEIRILS